MQGSGETYPRTAYLLSLIGGIMILVFSILYALILLAVASIFASVGFGLGVDLAVGLAVVALFLGIIVIFFALQLKSQPRSAKTYGILILVFAVISLIGGGGFYIGAILALIGGILAIVWHPPAQAQVAWGQPSVAPPGPPGTGG